MISTITERRNLALGFDEMNQLREVFCHRSSSGGGILANEFCIARVGSVRKTKNPGLCCTWVQLAICETSEENYSRDRAHFHMVFHITLGN